MSALVDFQGFNAIFPEFSMSALVLFDERLGAE
jgi:hypothetical protein